jgi:hypothetical protein
MKQQQSPRFNDTTGDTKTKTKEPLGSYWVRKTRMTGGTTGNVLQHTHRLQNEVIQSMRCGQNTLIAFELRLIDEELRYEPFMTFVKEPMLWFPVIPGETDPPSDSLFKPSPDAGYTLHSRFRPLLQWVHNQGLEYKLQGGRKGTFPLLLYWTPETIRPIHDENCLFKYYLTTRLATTEERQIVHFRSVIKNAMDAGQNTASLCILYNGKEGFQTTTEQNPDLRFTCKETIHLLTNKPINNNNCYYIINEKYEPIIHMIVDQEKLQWSLRFTEQQQPQNYAILIATWN